MLHAIVLICSVATPGAECTEATAIDVVQTDPGRSPVMCGLFGQATIAGTAIRPEMGKSYAKIVCTKGDDRPR